MIFETLVEHLCKVIPNVFKTKTNGLIPIKNIGYYILWEANGGIFVRGKAKHPALIKYYEAGQIHEIDLNDPDAISIIIKHITEYLESLNDGKRNTSLPA